LFNEKLFANTSLIFSNYQFNIFSNEKRKDAQYTLDYSSGIRDFTLKYDVDFLPNPQHSLKIGIVSTAHRFRPSALVIKNTEADKFKRKIQNIDVVESGLYVEDIYRPFDKLKINAGFRLSNFATKDRQYWRPEPRLSAAFNLQEDLSLKASYALMNQYVHLISNTGIGLPTDLWVPSTPRIAPQQSQQVAAGVAKDFIEPGISVTLEGYYKKSNHILGYKQGASFLLLSDVESAQEVNWEDNLTAGKGWSYGVELFVQKKVGRFSGWLGYTLSWTQLQYDLLNFGKKYYARYDRRHDISLVGIYKISPRITLSGTWVYATGNAITLPVSQYTSHHHLIQPRSNKEYKPYTDVDFYDESYKYSGKYSEFGPKNNFRMAAYHRMDVGIQFHKQKRWGERTWEISVYNVYNRQNPFFYGIDVKSIGNGQEKVVLKQFSLFPLIPSVSYNFKF
jgi:outer membrane receptor protein involved in Fe transport